MHALELAGVVLGIIAVWLTTRQNIWCWPTGILSVGLFVVVFHDARLYAAMVLQLAYVALGFYGWYAWLHGGSGHTRLTVSRVSGTLLALLAVAAAAAAALFGIVLARNTDAVVPYLDSALTSFSLVAQFLQARKWIENWFVWMIVDTAYVAMYLSQGLAMTALLYGVYLGLAFVGLIAWKRSLARI